MPHYDKRIDAYIAKSAPFAQPILTRAREIIHEACPEVKETLKWGMPAFEYHGILCGFSAFKQHCGFGFWKAALLEDPQGILSDEPVGMGSFGKMTSIKDLPPAKYLKPMIRQAMALNEAKVNAPHTAHKKLGLKKEIAEPEYFTKLLSKNKAAKATWEKFAPSHRKEYLEWMTEAKTDATREKRLTQTMAQLEEGKRRHWQYQKK